MLFRSNFCCCSIIKTPPIFDRYIVPNIDGIIYFFSALVIGGWGGVLPPHFGQKKSRRPFSDFLLGVPLWGGGYLVVKVRGNLTRCERFNKESVSYCRILLAKIRGIVYSYDVPFSLSDNCIVIVSSLSLSSLGTA